MDWPFGTNEERLVPTERHDLCSGRQEKEGRVKNSWRRTVEKKLGLRSWAEVPIVVWDRDRWKKLITRSIPLNTKNTFPSRCTFFFRVPEPFFTNEERIDPTERLHLCSRRHEKEGMYKETWRCTVEEE